MDSSRVETALNFIVAAYNRRAIKGIEEKIGTSHPTPITSLNCREAQRYREKLEGLIKKWELGEISSQQLRDSILSQFSVSLKDAKQAIKLLTNPPKTKKPRKQKRPSTSSNPVCLTRGGYFPTKGNPE